MKRLKKIKPSGRGLGTALPDGPGWYYPLFSTYHPAMEEFYGTALDTDDWISSNSTLGTGGAAISVASSFVTMSTGTGTAGTASLKIQSAGAAQNSLTAGNNVSTLNDVGHVYALPFRVKWAVRVSTTAGAGVAPTGGLDAYFGIRNMADNQSNNAVAAETHIAQFHLDMSTAAGTSLASPVLETQVYAGSTAAAFLSSSAFNPFSSAANRTYTATQVSMLVLEATHRGIWFAFQEDQSSHEAPRLLTHVGAPLIRHDLQYFIDSRVVANGTGGYTQTGTVNVEVDQIVIEQIANQWKSGDDQDPNVRLGQIRTYQNSAAMAPSHANSIATTGSGVLYGITVTTTATSAANLYIAAYDASAAGSAVYDYAQSAGANTLSTAARIIWWSHVMFSGSAPSNFSNPVQPNIPACGIPFFRGLVFGDTTVNGRAVGASAVQCLVVYRAQ